MGYSSDIYYKPGPKAMYMTQNFKVSLNAMMPFRLKEFLNEGPATRAKGSLSSSFAELTPLQSLFEIDPTLPNRINSFNGAYPGTQGSLFLREALSRFLAIDVENIIVTNGADEAITSVYAGLLSDGDLVSLIEPAYGPLKSLAQFYGANISTVKLQDGTDWHLPKEAWQQLLNRNARIIALNFPHNPTGWYPGDEELNEFLSQAQRASTLVISDEVYAGLNFDNPGTFRCLAAEYPEVVSIGSLSKSFGLPGLRIGWIASQQSQIIQHLKKLRMHTNTYVSAVSEHIAFSAIQNAPTILKSKTEIAQDGLQKLLGFISRNSNLWSLNAPSQGPVAFARWLGTENSTELCAQILKQLNLLIVPSDLFDYGDRYVRFGFGALSFSTNLAILEKHLHSKR